MNLPCGRTCREMGLERSDGTLDSDRVREHVLDCPGCRAFLDALEGGIIGRAYAMGLERLEEQEEEKRQKAQEQRQLRQWPQKVRRLRKILGLSQAALAERLAVARSTVVRWENGRMTPTPIARKAIETELDAFYNRLTRA